MCPNTALLIASIILGIIGTVAYFIGKNSSH